MWRWPARNADSCCGTVCAAWRCPGWAFRDGMRATRCRPGLKARPSVRERAKAFVVKESLRGPDVIAKDGPDLHYSGVPRARNLEVDRISVPFRHAEGEELNCEMTN